MTRLIDIEGVGATYDKKLKAAGIRGSGGLMQSGGTRQGRKQLAEKCGIDESLILEWVNHVDLMRVKGVGGEYADLLEEAGVDTIVELARRNPQNLYQQLATSNTQKKLVRKMPTEAQVKDWVQQAKELPRQVQY